MQGKATNFHVADASVWEEKFPDANVTFVGDLDDFFVEDNLRYKKIHQTETRASVRKAEGVNAVELVDCATAPKGAVDIPATVKHDGVDYSVTTIRESAFTNCTSLASITIPASVTGIGERAFFNCTSLTSVTFAEGSQLTSIGDHAFESCTNLTSITIPASMTSIGYTAFGGCI